MKMKTDNCGVLLSIIDYFSRYVLAVRPLIRWHIPNTSVFIRSFHQCWSSVWDIAIDWS